jgi:hypothetical protein
MISDSKIIEILNHICKYRQNMFPDCVSYNKFVELQKKITQPLAVFVEFNFYILVE